MRVRTGINADSSTIDGDLRVLDRFLEAFEGAGFSHAEIPVHGVDCLLDGTLLRERMKPLKQMLGHRRLGYTVHAPDTLNLADASDPALHMKALCATIDFASEIGAQIVVYHGSSRIGTRGAQEAAGTSGTRSVPPAGAAPDIPSLLMAWADEVDRLGKVAACAAAKGVTVAVENIFRQSADERTCRRDPRELAAIVGAVDSPALGICFDFGHAYISSKEEGFPLEAALDAVLPRLVHIHIHDNFGKACPQGEKTIDAMYKGAGDLHLPPGWGTLPYAPLFRKFSPAYRGVYMLELKPRFRDEYRSSLEWVWRMAGS
jgi:sugar phosphate isomerase/epimerase